MAIQYFQQPSQSPTFLSNRGMLSKSNALLNKSSKNFQSMFMLLLLQWLNLLSRTQLLQSLKKAHFLLPQSDLGAQQPVLGLQNPSHPSQSPRPRPIMKNLFRLQSYYWSKLSHKMKMMLQMVRFSRSFN